MKVKSKVRTCLLFRDEGEEAARFYVSILPDSHIENTVRTDPDQPPAVVEFTLGGAPFMTLNGGPDCTPNDAVSISVLTEDQAETDALWAKLIEGDGSEIQCGWLKDRYGVHWQIVPEVLPRLLGEADAEAAGRVMSALIQMKKIDAAALEAAFEGP